MKTYNVKLQFINSTEHDFWLALLKEEQQAFNLASTIVFNKKPVIALKQVYDITYREIRNVSVLLPAQGANKIIKSIISCFRSIKSNKHKLETAPMKKNLSLRLDKRLYSRFNKNTISLPSSIAQKRTDVKLILYPAVEKLFDNYTTADPLIHFKNGKFYLSVTFNLPDKPILNESVLGVDLGLKRLYTTSDGNALTGKEYNKQKRKIRYLKRCLQSKGTTSAKKHLKKVSKKEKNFSKNYIHNAVNQLLKTDKSILVIEDLTKIKAKNKGKKFNNKLSQMPFYMFKQILSYKALHSGRRVETVNPAYTSQIDCLTNQKDGTRKGCRYYSSTGIILDADWNAAINIACRKHPITFKTPKDGALNFMGRLLSINQTLDLSGKLRNL